MERLCQILLRLRWLVLGGAALATLLALAVVLHLRFDFSFTQFFPGREHPEIGAYFDAMDRFGRDDRIALIVAVPCSGSVFAAEPLTALARLSEELSALDGVVRVDSLATLRLAVDVEGALAMQPLYRADDGVAAAEIEAVRSAAQINPMVRGQLAAPGGEAMAIAVALGSNANGQDDCDPALTAIEAAAQRHFPAADYQLHLGGVPFVRAGYIALLEREAWQLALAAIGLLALVLFALFRSLRAMLIPLCVVSLATLASMAIFVATGHRITLMSTLIPIIVLVIGISDAIHLLSGFQEERARGLDVDAAIVRSFAQLAWPGLFNSATTALGFLALAVNAIGVIADFGTYAAIGVMLAFVVTALVLPPLLSVLPIADGYSFEAAARQPTGRLLAWHYRLASRWPRAIVAACALGGAALYAWSTHTIERDAYFVDDLAPDHPLVLATRTIERHFGGILPIDVVIAGPEGLANEPATARLAARVAARLQQEPKIGGVVGFADALALVQAAVDPGAAIDSRDQQAQLLLLAESADPDLFGRYVAADGRAVRVSGRVADLGTLRMRELIAHLRRDLAAIGAASGDLRVELTGFTPAAVWVDRYMVEQLFYGFAGVFVVILLVMAITFRSVVAALCALPPNAMPLVAILGWMALTGITIKPTTAVIFSIAFGMGVDNMIFFISRFRDELSGGCEPRRALSRTFATSGRGVLFTSAVLAIGFTAALPAQLGVSAQFGAMCIVTIISAGLSVLLLLPALLLWPWRGGHPVAEWLRPAARASARPVHDES
ncbi:MAG: MMPL family transporter [Deltaproteobacteria bacterium]|nr:MMPL family transporter [Deltaproteobacteria bacterium]